MYVFIHSKTIAVTAALRAFAERQARKLVKKGRKIEVVNVFVETIGRKKNDLQSAVAKMQVSIPGKDVIVERRSADLYQALMDVTNSASRQLGKVKDRRLKHRHHDEKLLLWEQPAMFKS